MAFETYITFSLLLLQFLKEEPIRKYIGVKRMGELDSRPFLEALRKKYNEDLAEERSTELCSLWEEYLRDPNWHPMRVVKVNDKHKVCH